MRYHIKIAHNQLEVAGRHISNLQSYIKQLRSKIDNDPTADEYVAQMALRKVYNETRVSPAQKKRS